MRRRRKTGGGGIAVDEEPWSITRVAQDLGVTLRTIRWYEDRGLVAPERRGQQRLFSARDRVRLALVLRGRRLGFSLEEIRTILDMYDAEPGEAGQLRYLLGEIRRRRAELEQRRADLEQTLAEFAELEGRCADDLARLEGPAA
ncbi:MerR family DNA-binding transcriptional regulator [Kineococcus sp. NUM-3379]